MPTVILEAMACETPVIASDIGAVSTMVNEQTGILIEPASTSSIVAALEKFTSLSKVEKTKMGNEARKFVKESYIWPVIAGKTYDLLKSMSAAV